MPGVLSGLPDSVLQLSYLVAGVLFIQGLRDTTHPRTATRGNKTSSAGMFLAVIVTIHVEFGIHPWPAGCRVT